MSSRSLIQISKCVSMCIVFEQFALEIAVMMNTIIGKLTALNLLYPLCKFPFFLLQHIQFYTSLITLNLPVRFLLYDVFLQYRITYFLNRYPE